MDAPKTRKTFKLPFHVVKRADTPLLRSIHVRVGAVAAAFLISALLSKLLTGASPVAFFRSMFDGSFGNRIYAWKFAKNVAVLLCISLAVTPAFRMKFWNIGANGQVLVGALAAVGCILAFGKTLPRLPLLLVMCAAAACAGVVWAVVPAVFKALWGTNETLFTLMMNYIATYLVSFFLLVWVKGGETTLKPRSEGHLFQIREIPGMEKIDGRGYLLLILIVLLMTASMFVYLKFSKHGYELSVVGESEKTARYIGINVKKVIIRTMILSGAVCGVAGFLIVSALDHTITPNTAGSLGFTAIMVSWLANFNPLYMILTSALIVFLQSGAAQISTNFGVSSAFPDMIIGIILFFVIGCEFFIRYQIRFSKNEREAAK